MEEFTQTFSMQNIASGSIIAKRYEVQEKIGSGGMGLVFKVLDRHLNNEVVALKLLHPHLAQDDEVFARFQNEVLVARSLSHPNIVRLHDMGKAEQGFSYISMEYVDGYSLNERIAKKANKRDCIPTEPLEFSEAISILVRLLSGVSYAHGKGIIHRDLKPANVMISVDDEVKLADFGTARIVGMTAGLTQTGQTIGTPDYMSPEQIQGLSLDAATDIYSLGIIAYELVVGEKPFSADSAVAVAFKHMHEPVPEFADPDKGIPKWFQDIVNKATAKDKEQRFPSAFEFAEAISLHAPDSLSKGTFFLSDRTLFSGNATSTEVNQAISSDEPPGKSGSNSDEFVLGKKGAGEAGRKVDADGWSFGDAHTGDAPAEETLPPVALSKKKDESEGMFRNVVLLAASVALFLGGLTASALFVPGVGQTVVSGLQGIEGATGLDLSTLTSMFGVAEPQTDEPVDAVAGKTPEEEPIDDAERKRLAEELLLAAAGGEIPKSVETKPKDEKVEAKAPKKEGAKAVEPSGTKVSEPAKEPEKKPAVEPAKVEKVPEVQIAKATKEPKKEEAKSAEVKPAVVEPPPPPPVIVKADSAVFRLGNRVNNSASLLSNELGRTSWDVNVSGLKASNKRALGKLVAKDFSANVVLASEGKLVKKLPVELRKAKNNVALAVGGNLRGLASNKELVVGDYRLDIIRKGEVLSSTPFSLSKASVVVKSKPSSQAGGKIAIVRGPAYKPPTPAVEPEPKKEPTPSKQAVPPASGPGKVVENVPVEMPLKREYQPLIPPSSGATEPTRVGNNPTTSSLPPARRLPGSASGGGLKNSEYNVSSIDLMQQGNIEKAGNALAGSNTASRETQVSAGPAREKYLGVLSLKSDEGVQERSLELRVSISDTEISGEASLEGYGNFSVSGKVYPRGIEMTLRGQTAGVRLSGVKRGDSMRGRYYIPAEKLRGSWKVSK